MLQWLGFWCWLACVVSCGLLRGHIPSFSLIFLDHKIFYFLFVSGLWFCWCWRVPQSQPYLFTILQSAKKEKKILFMLYTSKSWGIINCSSWVKNSTFSKLTYRYLYHNLDLIDSVKELFLFPRGWIPWNF